MHALMLVGHDQKERTLIVRDSRPNYNRRFYGMAKIPMRPLKDETLAYIQLIVTS